MSIIDKAKKKLDEYDYDNPNEYLESKIMTCFNIIGLDLLENETVYYNIKEDIMELIYEFNLSKEEIVDYLVYNDLYNKNYRFILFDGHNLESFESLSYFIKQVRKHMNMELANILLDLD